MKYCALYEIVQCYLMNEAYHPVFDLILYILCSIYV